MVQYIHPRLAGPANIRYALISLVQEFLFTIYLLWLHLAAFQRTSAAKLRERKKKSLQLSLLLTGRMLVHLHCLLRCPE
jgi:hypothetical protein